MTKKKRKKRKSNGFGRLFIRDYLTLFSSFSPPTKNPQKAGVFSFVPLTLYIYSAVQVLA